MTIQKLQNLPQEQLISLMEKYPFAAFFPVLAAKSEKHQQGNFLAEYKTRASLRVPSRLVFKDYMNQELQWEFSLTETALNNQEKKLTHQEAKKAVQEINRPLAEPLQKAFETDKGEIVLENLTTVKPSFYEEVGVKEVVVDGKEELIEVTHGVNVGSDNELKEADIDTSDELAEEFDLYSDEPLKNATETDKGEIVLDNPITVKPPNYEEVGIKEVVVDGNQKQVIVDEQPLLDNEITEEAENAESQQDELQSDQEIHRQAKQKIGDVSFAGFGNSPYISQQRDLEDFRFVEPEKDLRKIELPIEDDLIDEIADELVIEEELEKDIELELYELDSEPVSSLNEQEGETSMYKKIVSLLKEDGNPPKPQITQDIVVDADYQPTEIQQRQQEKTTLDRKQDTELETLYAQAAYEAQLEHEIALTSKNSDKKKEEKLENQGDQEELTSSENKLNRENNFSEKEELQDKNHIDSEEKITTQFVDQSQRHSFSGWLGQLSQMGTVFVSDQKEHQERKEHIERNVSPEKTIVREPKPVVEMDDKPEISTRQVQEMARLSTLPSKDFYTETLAYVYELQDKWSKAIEVYEQLSLQNPEKSSYFASQIKLLKEKLK